MTMDEKTRIAAVLDALAQLQAAESNPGFSAEKYARIERLREEGHEPLAPNCTHSEANLVFQHWECAPLLSVSGRDDHEAWSRR